MQDVNQLGHIVHLNWAQSLIIDIAKLLDGKIWIIGNYSIAVGQLWICCSAISICMLHFHRFLAYIPINIIASTTHLLHRIQIFTIIWSSLFVLHVLISSHYICSLQHFYSPFYSAQSCKRWNYTYHISLKTYRSVTLCSYKV